MLSARCVVVSCTMMMATSAARPSWAGVSDAIYEDAKAVIEDLLSAEIAQSLVPQIVCLGGRTEELASPTDCKARLGAADHAAVCYSQGSRFVIARLRLLEAFPATLQALYSRRFGALGATVSQEVVEVASDAFYHALGDDFATIKKELVAALDPQVRVGIDFANELAPPSGTVLAPLPAAAMSACVAQVRERLSAGVSGSISTIDRECARAGVELVRGPSGGLEVTRRAPAERALPCELAQTMRLALLDRSAEAAVSGRRAAALVMAHAQLARLSVGGTARRALLFPLTDELTSLLLVLERAHADTGASAAAFAAFSTRSSALIAQTCARHATDCPPPGAGQPEATVAAALVAHQPLIARVATRLVALTAGGAVPLRIQPWIVEVADALVGPGSMCEGLDVPACQLLDELPLRAGAQSLVWPAVRAASSGDLRAAAHLVIATFFGRDTQGSRCERATFDERCQRDAFRRFADALVMYVLDAARGDTSEAVRTVFRQAASEAIRFLSPFGGLDRGGAAIGRSVDLSLMPELVLRASWSSGHTSDELGHYRTVAGLPLLRARKIFWYTDRSYAALQLSLLDPLAPLAEIVLRADRDAFSGRPVTYANDERLIWNAIAPRLEWTAALPWLSKHLAVGAGLGVRWMTATARAVTDDEVRYTYQGPGEAPWYDHVELGLALKYLP